ncbi:AcrR family transcriptional regulator [Arcanobacterium wilhelmae]|uniref:AcrR family transcriptional regulator n=1 Tax=Arcanobacterium wilhelmae TaxID=1803177 RepID=A0ABT9NAR6_9ACTO|nr:TetR/AcrR family transcriptional regulator [Arcanobacterium wilhelmae]MDP9800809.1 AcrR family transcriptional regulator [Arcanobacterium wilhelmae]WFN90185.1 TetR/AcrR family transcriptional regulator [Arcanobacterium wilhelmae]
MSPKIAAPTVKEHHDNMFEKLIDAAEDVLRHHGVAQLTAGAVAQRAGIARNSIYRYVESVDDLREHVISRYIPRWQSAVSEALEGVEDPRECLLTYLRVALELAEETGHRWLIGVMGYKGGKNAKAKGTEAAAKGAGAKGTVAKEGGRKHRVQGGSPRDVVYGPEVVRDFHKMLADSITEPVGKMEGVTPAVAVPLLTALLRAGMGELDEGCELSAVTHSVLAAAEAIIQPA